MENGEKTPLSGGKGFAIILGCMLAVMGVLWLLASLASQR